MDDLILYGTPKTPTVKLKYSEGLFQFSGVSIPEDSLGFYGPIIQWLKEYSKAILPNTKMVFKFSYLNTSSLQAIFDILILFEDKPIEIEWYYLSDDSDMREIGEDFKNSVNVNISLIEVIAA